MCYTYGNCFSRFCSGQRETKFGMYSNIFGTLAHLALAYYLCVYNKYEMHGVAIASSVHFAVRFLVFIVLIYFSPKLRAGLQSIWSEESRSKLMDQFKLSLQCASLGIWSWWAFDIFTLIASYMSIDDLSAQTVLRNIGLLTFMIPVGLSISSTILVGNMIGANNVKGARKYAEMCTLSAHLWALASVVVINVL